METKRKSSDSWIDNVEINDKNFVGRKNMDYSMFNHGTFIPARYQSKFFSNLSNEVELGSSLPITLIINDIEFKAKIDKPNSKNRKTPAIRMLYSNKLLKEILQEKFEKSYDYIMNYIKENDKKPNRLPEEFEEYMDFYKGDSLDKFVVKLISSEDINNDEDNKSEEFEEINDDNNEEACMKFTNIVEDVEFIHNYIKSKGFNYDEALIKNFYISLRTKPFVILSGISGTGKSKIVELFAEAIGANFENERFKIVPVKPDWSDATDLLGYRNIEGKFTPGIITLVAYEAMKNPDKPYFICLDEMNLARVEYYFSDILSLMETRRVNKDGEIVTEKILSREQFGRDERSFDKYGDVYIPQNLYIIGTVNMDETTFPFSKKVLDRANTIEFNKVELDYAFEDLFIEEIEERKYYNDFLKSQFLKIAQCKEHKELVYQVIDKLKSINEILEKYNQHFGFRVRDEIVFYMIYAVENNLMSSEQAFDYCMIQKILPKLNGSNNDILEILIKLFNYINTCKFDSDGYISDDDINNMNKLISTSNYKLSSEKIIYMIRRFVRDGFTTFWQ